MNRNVTGFYHDPPIFLVENPVEDDGRGPVHFERFDAEVLRRTFSNGVEMCATVEGLFAFAFNALADCNIEESAVCPGGDFAVIAEAIVRRTRIMNAYLAFFYTHQGLVDRYYGLDRMVVTPELTVGMTTLGKDSGKGTGNQRVSQLVASGIASTYLPDLPHSTDSRIIARSSPPPISLTVVQSAAADLSALFDDHGNEGVLIVDLFLRASKAYQDHNNSLSLINYWTIIERLLNDLWKQMQEDFMSHNGEKVFIDGTRRKRLRDGRTFTASVMSEMLSFLDYISKDLYDDMSSVRKVRTIGCTI